MKVCSSGGRERAPRRRSKEGVAAPVVDAYRHETTVLVGEHTLLKMGKSTSVGHRLAVAIVAARMFLAASARIDEMQIFFMLHQGGVGHLMQAGDSHRAAAMLAYRIV